VALKVLDKLELPVAPVDDVDVARLADIKSSLRYGDVNNAYETRTVWVDGRPVWRTVLKPAAMTPGTAGLPVTTIAGFRELVRMDGHGSLADDGSKPTIAVNGSGFSASLAANGVLTLYGPAGATLYKIVFIVEYTKT
jgi:hypothetical protein